MKGEGGWLWEEEAAERTELGNFGRQSWQILGDDSDGLTGKEEDEQRGMREMAGANAMETAGRCSEMGFRV